MMLKDVGMIVADTSRSRAYLQALVRNELLPAYILLLEHDSGEVLPGQANSINVPSEKSLNFEKDDCWSEADFNRILPIKPLLDKLKIPYEVSQTTDINHLSVVNFIKKRVEPVFIFSGFGGVLLGKDLLNTGKKFLHVHGGYLPDYKGSTTNYYSLIDEGSIGASSIFLNEVIDSGSILMRKKFPPPLNKQEIDHKYDSAARAKILVETLQKYMQLGNWDFELPCEHVGETFYIIHPVLKHIAILDKGS